MQSYSNVFLIRRLLGTLNIAIITANVVRIAATVRNHVQIKSKPNLKSRSCTHVGQTNKLGVNIMLEKLCIICAP